MDKQPDDDPALDLRAVIAADFALDLRVVKYLLAAAVTGVNYTSPRDGDASDIEGVLRWAYERAASEESRT